MKRIFISYSHKDEEWKNRLEQHLNVLNERGLLTWSDRNIDAGEDWFEEIEEALNAAEVIIMLISADFLNSDFIKKQEIPRALQRRQDDGVLLLPIIVRSCAWKKVDWLRSIQVRPKDGEALSKIINDGEIDSHLAVIVEEIDGILSEKERQRRTVRKSTSPSRVEQPESQPLALNLPCKGQPELEFLTAHSLYLLTEANEWFVCKLGDNQWRRLAALSTCSAALVARLDSLVVALYEKTPVRLKDDQWVRIPCDHTVLALTSTNMGIVAGESTGKLFLLDDQEASRIPALQTSEPILGLISVADEGIVALGVKGGLWTTEWPYDPKSPAKPIDLASFERPLALYKSGRSNYVLLMGANRLALLHFYSGSIRTVSSPIAKGLRSLCVSSNSSESYSVLTDAGALYLVSRDLQRITEVKLPKEEGEVAGVRALPKGGRLVWTTQGNLHIVGEDGALKYLAGNQVVMAFALPGEREVLLIRWQPNEDARLQYTRLPG